MTKHLPRWSTVWATIFVLTVTSAWFSLSKAFCSNCESTDIAGIRKTFMEFDEQCRKQMAGTMAECFSPNIYNKILPIMKALGKDNRFGPADRVFVLGEPQTGNAVSGTERIYQTAAPIDKDQLTVSFRKLTGVNGALVKICAVSEDGTVRRVGTIDVEGGNDPGEDSATLSGMRGRIIRIGIVGRGSATGKLQFSWVVR